MSLYNTQPSITTDFDGNLYVAFYSNDTNCGCDGPTGATGISFQPNVLGITGFTAGNDPNVNVNNAGQEWIDPVTGQRFVSNGTIFVEVPCCVDITNNENNTITFSQNGEDFRALSLPTNLEGLFVLGIQGESA
jgi:hypothetical protein